MNVWLRIGGIPATEIAAHGPVTYESWADGGCGSASWSFALTVTSQHQALRVGSTLVEVMCGLMPVWTGLLSDADRNTWECTAFGLASEAQKYPALDGTLANTREIGAAIAQAQSMGWPVFNTFGLAGTAAGEATGNPVSVAQLLTDYAEQTGQRWGVDAQRRVWMRPTPTDVSWLASPGSAAFGTTNEDRATRLLGRYLDSTTGVHQTASSGSGAPVETVDLSERGAMTGTAAEAILAGMLHLTHVGPAWTNGASLTSDQLQTMGGSRAFLPVVQAGRLVRTLGLSNAVQPLTLDTVIGKTRYTTGEPSIYVEPVNTAPRNAVDVWAA